MTVGTIIVELVSHYSHDIVAVAHFVGGSLLFLFCHFIDKVKPEKLTYRERQKIEYDSDISEKDACQLMLLMQLVCSLTLWGALLVLTEIVGLSLVMGPVGLAWAGLLAGLGINCIAFFPAFLLDKLFTIKGPVTEKLVMLSEKIGIWPIIIGGNIVFLITLFI